jgi:uncharacterized membrane protein
MEYLIFLRLIHIVCAVIWAGGMIYLAAFVIPAAKTLGSDGTKFIQRLSGTNKLPIVMNVSAILTIVSGIILIQKLFGGIHLCWEFVLQVTDQQFLLAAVCRIAPFAKKQKLMGR